ncbi:MAG: DUF5682 family protein [Byssovorax sp.]
MAPRGPTKTRKTAPTAPSTGPLAHVFGIRHLSPRGAIHLERFLEQVNPTAVLVEGPSDADPILPHLADKRTRPPVALLCFTEERPVRSILFPLAEYSPEWAALRWALRRRRLARFIDLPASVFLGRDALPRTAPEDEGAGPDEPTDTQAYLADPYGAIARLAGEPDHETWWEKHFEHTTAEDAYRQAIFELGRGLREVEYEGPRRRQETLIRESFMRRQIRKVIAEGHDPARIVVVCGAYHAPVLTAELPAMSDEEERALPRSRTTLTLMPYSYYRLSARAGYGAGNSAPGYFQALWEEGREGGSGSVGPRILAEVAGRMRRAGIVRTSADVIEATRLAEALAALGEGAHAPTLRDLRDAAVTCLGHGDPSGILRWFDEVVVGDALGRVPPGASRTSIQDDFHRSITDLRLAGYLRDKEQIIKGRGGHEWLDLRQDRFAASPDGAFRDRRRSIFLHRLSLLGTGFAEDVTGEDDRRTSTYKEVWRARWTPSCEVALVESALRGDTVEQAALLCLREQLAMVATVEEAASLARRAVECDLPHGVRAALAVVQALAVDDTDFLGMAAAAVELCRLARYGDVRPFDPAPLRPLVAQLFLRATLLSQGASRCAKDAERAVGRGLIDLQTVALLAEDGSLGDLGLDRFARALDAIADDDRASPHVAGLASALLLERGLLPDAVLDRRIQRRLSPGTDPEAGAAFVEGLAAQNRHALLSHQALFSHLSAFIDGLADAELRRAIVALRRAFAPFEPGEIRRIVAILGEIWGGGAGDLEQAVETRLDAAELAALERDLEGLRDLA